MLYMEGSKKMKEASDNLKTMLKREAVNDLETMDEITLKTIQSVFSFIDAANDIIEEQETALKSIDEKLDKLLIITTGRV